MTSKPTPLRQQCVGKWPQLFHQLLPVITAGWRRQPSAGTHFWDVSYQRVASLSFDSLNCGDKSLILKLLNRLFCLDWCDFRTFRLFVVTYLRNICLTRTCLSLNCHVSSRLFKNTPPLIGFILLIIGTLFFLHFFFLTFNIIYSGPFRVFNTRTGWVTDRRTDRQTERGAEWKGKRRITNSRRCLDAFAVLSYGRPLMWSPHITHT